MEIFAEIFNRELFIEMLPSPKQNDDDERNDWHTSRLSFFGNRRGWQPPFGARTRV